MADAARLLQATLDEEEAEPLRQFVDCSFDRPASRDEPQREARLVLVHGNSALLPLVDRRRHHTEIFPEHAASYVEGGMRAGLAAVKCGASENDTT
ncbi:hypothetical protein ABIC01_008496 [Bradyrhizobium sp. RT4b]